MTKKKEPCAALNRQHKVINYKSNILINKMLELTYLSKVIYDIVRSVRKLICAIG